MYLGVYACTNVHDPIPYIYMYMHTCKISCLGMSQIDN